ncbi:MAG TPA: hypothetical protein VFV54_07115, partial [Thermoanaerobaculia bacterium]|nr:hypothetical protein [Thermoanaerobaculia bacterium]
ERAQQWPKFLPDGEHFVYKSIRQEGERAIFVASTDRKKPPRKLIAADAAEIAPPRHLLFVRESTALAQEIDLGNLEMKGAAVPIVENLGTNEGTGYVAITASSSGVLAYRASQAGARNRLAWFDRTGRELGAVLEPGFYFDPAISPDGKKIAYALADPGKQMVGDIWIVDAVRGTRSRLTFDPADEYAPVWAPDGSSVAYSLAGGDQRKILRKLASGAGEPQVMLDRADVRAISDWSRDGRFFGFVSHSGTLDIGVAALEGAAWKPEVFLKTPFDEAGARFSPDGKWIAYVSAENGRAEVFLQTFPPSGGKWQISTAGGAQPVWRGDGRELFYLDLQTRLMSVKLEFQAETVEASVPETLFQAQLGGPLLAWNHYDVTADGQTFLFDPPSEASSAMPITVVLGWNAKVP